ncbi:hypothetical protein HNY73_000449 [Argiope bruennichi]|uniref:Uncharacterized protein n=1 Tax=Argiope bruennichi TaxID=94029 RepID=A0A8T0G0R2_ARGBR|nr:hypothetical protein HNY73_000449 [Argiope bruennichi]
MAKNSKNKSNFSTAKGRKKESPTHENAKTSKRKQKAPEIIDQKKQKTENKNATLEEKADEVVQDQSTKVSGEQDGNVSKDEENAVLTDLTDAYNQQNEETVQILAKTTENQNIQAKQKLR